MTGAPDPALEAARELAVAHKAHDEAYQAMDEGRGTKAARDAAYDRMEAARMKLATTEATTLAGLKAKVREMCEANDGPPGTWEEALPRGIVADMERLIG